MKCARNAHLALLLVLAASCYAHLGDNQKALDAQPLIVDHEIVNLPSASVLAVLREEFGNRKPHFWAPFTIQGEWR